MTSFFVWSPRARQYIEHLSVRKALDHLAETGSDKAIQVAPDGVASQVYKENLIRLADCPDG